jgi:ATP/maltotriose-dependent transcriptional regulator MalT
MSELTIGMTSNEALTNSMFLIDSFTEMVLPDTELVVEKISQPTEPPRISRPRLLQDLTQSLNSRASTILIGRAGTGKTALALDFSLKCGRRAAWYKVDAPEASMRVFFQYLVASLRQAVPDFGSQTLRQLVADANPEQLPLLAEAVVYDLSECESEPLLVVIDDLHLVCDANWVVPFFQRVLPLLPSHVHLLITSRTMPPAPLWRLRSKQMLLVIDEDTLAFTRVEAAELFESYGLSREQASIAVDHTHGRAAALASFAASLGTQEARLSV